MGQGGTGEANCRARAATMPCVTGSRAVWKHLQVRVAAASLLDVDRLTPDSYFDQISYVTKWLHMKEIK